MERVWQVTPGHGDDEVWAGGEPGAILHSVALGDGLPTSFWVAMMRDAMCADDHESAGLDLGARNGTVWVSADEGETWSCAVANLPDVTVVRAARIRA